jgi:hypothetical protein
MRPASRSCLAFKLSLILEFTFQPGLFTLLTKKMKARLRCLGIRLIFCLGDILILGFPFNICLGNLIKALSPLIEAGFIVNWEKPSLSTLTNFSFLRMVWGSTEGSLGRPWVKLERLHGQALLFLSCPLPSRRQVMVLTGFVAAFHNAVPLLRLKGRFIQVSLN